MMSAVATGGNANQWGPVTDLDTGEVLDPRSEVNSFKPIYEDGEGDWIPLVWSMTGSGRVLNGLHLPVVIPMKSLPA